MNVRQLIIHIDRPYHKHISQVSFAPQNQSGISIFLSNCQEDDSNNVRTFQIAHNGGADKVAISNSSAEASSNPENTLNKFPGNNQPLKVNLKEM